MWRMTVVAFSPLFSAGDSLSIATFAVFSSVGGLTVAIVTYSGLENEDESSDVIIFILLKSLDRCMVGSFRVKYDMEALLVKVREPFEKDDDVKNPIVVWEEASDATVHEINPMFPIVFMSVE